MSNIDRQNRLIVAEDWRRIYQSLKNADFTSYDFDNLRRTMVSYLRENYPEDFNDYIESSEYLALIDLLAYLGQSLAFRSDLNARDNFLELAERRDSVLRLAQLVSYNVRRNQCANGLLKINSISTTESVIDSNGRDVSNQTIVWNDPSNTNWYEQFIKVINAALPESRQFGKPQDQKTISGIKTEQYRFNMSNTELPIYSFNKNIDGQNVIFEVTSCEFKNSDQIYESPPRPGSSLSFLYRTDGQGNASSNTGFFVHFRQGIMQESLFAITRPSTSEIVDVDTPNINQDDFWLYDLDTFGNEQDLWTPVPAITGNNVIYNSLSKNIRKVYSIRTRVSDQVRLIFADGVFGDLPQGNFRIYYRVSANSAFTINPTDIRNVVINIPYVSRNNISHRLTINLGLKYTVNNATASETSEDIKTNAPAVYYTQNRMITGEDYNVFPLSTNQEIIKIKSINRISSGISRYLDLKDPSGKYSTTNLFGTDGILYKEPVMSLVRFTATSKKEIEDAVINTIEPQLQQRDVKNFYLDQLGMLPALTGQWGFIQQSFATNLTTGYICDVGTTDHKPIGSNTTSNLKYIVPEAMIKFVPPSNMAFGPNNQLVPSTTTGSKSYIWVKVSKVNLDPTIDSSLAQAYSITLNDFVPSGSIVSAIVPKFNAKLDAATKAKVIDIIFAQKNFGLRYDLYKTSWIIITDSNIDRLSDFSMGHAGSTAGQNLDSSWIALVETDGEAYTIRTRGSRYVFESEGEMRFFFDSTDKVYDPVTNSIIKDTITVLGINETADPDPRFNLKLPLGRDHQWEIIGNYKGGDGYIDSRKIAIGFFDNDDDGVVDDPELFKLLVDPNVNRAEKLIFLQRRPTSDGAFDYYYVKNTNNLIKIYQNQITANQDIANLTSLQVVYILDENLAKTFHNGTFHPNSEFKGLVGRDGLKFQYVHAAPSNSRIDPAVSNIIDIYLLTRSYDTEYRNWVRNNTVEAPKPPSSDSLNINFSSGLNAVKATSDEIIYHPAKYKPIFGTSSDISLQAIFKIVKSENTVISDNDIKSRVISAFDEFFAIENWDFGDTFYFSELSAFVMNQVAPYIASFVIVPRHQDLVFGSLHEIKAGADEIIISTASVNDIEIISEITATRIRASGAIVSSFSQQSSSTTSR